MRIAIFTDTYDPQVNGVARTLKRLTSHMAKRRVEYELFVPEMKSSLRAYPNIHEFTSFPFFFYPECRTAIANPKTIERRLRDFNPDLIHIATPLTMGLYGQHASKRLGIPVVASYHTHFDRYLDYYKMSWISPVLWKYMKWFHSNCEKIFVPSMETKNHLIQQGFENLSIWSRGVDCTLYDPSKTNNSIRNKYGIKEKFIILFAGRLAPEKDLETLVNTIKGLSDDVKKQVHWLIAGDGPCRREISMELQNKNVTMAGYLEGEELAEVYASSDLFFFPSPTETFGNVVLEAGASGLPSIVADEGGVTSIIENQMNGVICPAHSTEDFIKSTERLIENGDFRYTLGENARQYAKKQSWDSIFDQLLNEYLEVIDINQNLRRHA
ncbi:glycosyltransferase family 4 protein [Bacillus sp. AK031]